MERAIPDRLNEPNPNQYPDPEDILERVFGHKAFRPLQREIIDGILAGRDTLAVMPTGGGKSLCYQVPALAFPGMTVVVSPLIALMQDQVNALLAKGVDAAFLNSSLDRETYFETVERIRDGSIKLLYLAPESLANDRTKELLANTRIDCFTIDEAHCISEWGHDFRPEYRTLAELRGLAPKAVCLALTATATKQVRADIRKTLALNEPAEFVASFNRKNIYLSVEKKHNPVHRILDFLAERPDDAGIIYCFSRKQVDDLAAELTSRGHAALSYHAGLSDEKRSQNQEKFLGGQARVMVATVAFGMGIDKSDVRFVIHYDMPKGPEQYYQEIGRAGRDGKPATALLLYGYGDTRKIRFFMEDLSAREAKKAEDRLSAMTAYAEARTCRRAALLEWFGERYVPDSANGPCCDVCDRPPAAENDVTVPAQKLLSCVLRTGERYGLAYVVDVLTGSRQKRILENNHHKLSTWGIGSEYGKDDWFELGRVLVEEGYLSKSEDYGVLGLTHEAKSALTNRETISLPVTLAAERVNGYGDVGGGRGGTAEVAGSDTGPGFRKGRTDRGARGTGTRKTPAQTAAPDPAADPEGARIFTELKRLRTALARAASVPPYIIFNDRTLEAIAAAKPAKPAELLGVTGIGALKAEKYGEFILKAVRGEPFDE